MKSQVSTEYLVILAILVLLGLLFAFRTTSFLSIGNNLDVRNNELYWENQELAVVGSLFNSTFGSLYFYNSYDYPVSLTNFSIDEVMVYNGSTYLEPGEVEIVYFDYIYDKKGVNLKLYYQELENMNEIELEGATEYLLYFGELNYTPPPFSGWCYQENAAISNASDGGCDLDYSGSYTILAGDNTFFNDDWTDSATSSVFELEYVRPDNLINASLEVKLNPVLFGPPPGYTCSTSGTSETKNYTIPSDCLIRSDGFVKFEIGSGGGILLFCLDESDVKNLVVVLINDGCGLFTEEAMWWNISP